MRKPNNYECKDTARKKIAYNTAEEESFWSSGLLGDHNGVALTNANFKNLSEHFGLRGRQDPNDAYVQDFEVVWIQLEGGEKAKCVCFSENPTKAPYWWLDG